MLTAHERSELVKAARLYYEDNLTQAEVAVKMGVSRPTVSKMLTRARETGIVHIEIRAGNEGNADLLRQLQDKYGLLGGVVIADEKKFWQQAADYISDEVRFDKYVGVGWGYAMSEVFKALSSVSAKKQEGHLYPLIGSAHVPGRGYHPDELVKQWSEVCGRVPHLLSSPAFPASLEELEECEAAASYADVHSCWQQTDAVIVGVKGYPGVPDEATATRFGDSLKQQKAAGSFLSYFFNERGSFISGNNDYCLHIPLSILMRCRKVVGIIGDHNIRAVSGALKTGLLTHIVITEKMARKLL